MHLAVLPKLRPKRLIGDESEYATVEPPNVPWIRVPGQRWLIQGALRFTAHPVWLNIGLSILTIAILAGYCALHFGAPAAIFVVIAMLFSVERIVLSHHLWPDIGLGLVLVCVSLLAASNLASAPVLVAVLAAMALTLRIEAAALCVVASLSPVLTSTGTGWVTIVPALICATAVVALSVRAKLLHGIFWFDTTVPFNWRVAQKSVAMPDAPLNQVMRSVAEGSSNPAQPGRAMAHLPVLLSRIRTYIGAETFIRQSLLRDNRAEYADANWLDANHLIRLNLKYGFTFLVVMFLIFSPLMPISIWVTFSAVVILYTAVQTRSRYRMVVLPTMVLGIAHGLQTLIEKPDLNAMWPGFIATLLALVILKLAPERREF